MKKLLAEYGRVAIGVYLTIFAVVLLSFAAAIQAGFEVEGAAAGAGVLVSAWVATKVTQPLRILATVVLTPIVAAVIGRLRPPKDEAKS